MAARRFPIALLLVLTACSSDKTQNPPPDAPPGAAGPSVRFGATQDEALGAGAQSFNVNLLSNLWLAYNIRDIPDVAVLRIDTYTPSGLPFTSYIAAYSRDLRAHPSIVPRGLVDPVAVQPIRTDASNRVVLVYSMAISGTDFVRHTMSGLWRIKVALDDVPGSEIYGQITLGNGP